MRQPEGCAGEAAGRLVLPVGAPCTALRSSSGTARLRARTSRSDLAAAGRAATGRRERGHRGARRPPERPRPARPCRTRSPAASSTRSTTWGPPACGRWHAVPPPTGQVIHPCERFRPGELVHVPDGVEPLLSSALAQGARDLADRRLTGPDLSPSALARELNVSPRTLQRAFAREGRPLTGGEFADCGTQDGRSRSWLPVRGTAFEREAAPPTGEEGWGPRGSTLSSPALATAHARRKPAVLLGGDHSTCSATSGRFAHIAGVVRKSVRDGP